MKKPKKKTRKQVAKMLSEVVRAVSPVYAQHGKQITGIVLPKNESRRALRRKGAAVKIPS